MKARNGDNYKFIAKFWARTRMKAIIMRVKKR